MWLWMITSDFYGRKLVSHEDSVLVYTTFQRKGSDLLGEFKMKYRLS